MRVNNWISFLCIMAAIAIGVAIAMMLSDIATVKAGWCDARPACLRDWIGALSGWIAAAGALVAAALTVPHLRAQAKESRAQTEFVIGRSLPSVSFYDPPRPDLDGLLLPNSVKLTNWNRDSIQVLEVSVESQIRCEIAQYYIPSMKRQFHAPFDLNFHLEGWVDKSRPPDSLAFDIMLLADIEEATSASTATIILDIQVNSDKPYRAKLSATNPSASIINRRTLEA